jgi:hypothetical protein
MVGRSIREGARELLLRNVCLPSTYYVVMHAYILEHKTAKHDLNLPTTLLFYSVQVITSSQRK